MQQAEPGGVAAPSAAAAARARGGVSPSSNAHQVREIPPHQRLCCSVSCAQHLQLAGTPSSMLRTQCSCVHRASFKAILGAEGWPGTRTGTLLCRVRVDQMMMLASLLATRLTPPSLPVGIPKMPRLLVAGVPYCDKVTEKLISGAGLLQHLPRRLSVLVWLPTQTWTMRWRSLWRRCRVETRARQ